MSETETPARIGTNDITVNVGGCPTTAVGVVGFKESVTVNVVREYVIPELKVDPDILLKMRVLWDVAHNPGTDAELVAERVGASVMTVAEIMDDLAARGVLGLS